MWQQEGTINSPILGEEGLALVASNPLITLLV